MHRFRVVFVVNTENTIDLSTRTYNFSDTYNAFIYIYCYCCNDANKNLSGGSSITLTYILFKF